MINIIGLGYIGLPTALMFAAHGEQMMGTDCKEEVIAHLRDGVLDTEEQGMSELYAKGILCFRRSMRQQICILLRCPHRIIRIQKK